MGRIALYRKYRSRALNEVIGQEHITSVLEPAIASGQFSHAYLLTGPRGIGKTSVARIIAHLVNNFDYDGKQHIDIIEIDGASNTSVDNIRELSEKANILPVSAKYKIYIIDEVHMLSSGAFNALLKILEEPPEHIIFILATTEVHKLPATILSRTQRFHFHPVEPKKVAQHLRMIADKEKIKIDDNALDLIARHGGGSFRDSITLLDQISGLGRLIKKEDVEDILGIATEDEIDSLINAVLEKNYSAVVEILKKFRNQGFSAAIISRQLNEKLANLEQNNSIVYEIMERLIEVSKSSNPDLKLLAILASASSEKNIATPIVPKKVIKKNSSAQQDDKKSTPPKEKTSKIKSDITTKKQEAKNPDENPVEAEEQESVAPEKTPAQTKNNSTEITDIDWDKVKEEATKINAVVGSLIGSASIDFEDNTLTLYYKHKIQRNKMKEAKSMKVLSDSIANIYGDLPQIVIADGSKPMNDTLSKVADIMGGGEAL